MPAFQSASKQQQLGGQGRSTRQLRQAIERRYPGEQVREPSPRPTFANLAPHGAREVRGSTRSPSSGPARIFGSIERQGVPAVCADALLFEPGSARRPRGPGPLVRLRALANGRV
jgi:hypothetical protein